MEELHSIVGNYFGVYEEMRQLSAQTKEKRIPLKERATLLEQDILHFMERNELDILKFGERKIELKTVERKTPITKKNLPTLLSQYFKNPTDAANCFQFLLDSAGSSQVRCLRRGKAAAKGAKKQKAAQAASENPPIEDDDDDDDDDDE